MSAAAMSVALSSSVSGHAKLVLLVLADGASDQDGFIVAPGQRTMDTCSLAPGDFNAAVRELVAAGYLVPFDAPTWWRTACRAPTGAQTYRLRLPR